MKRHDISDQLTIYTLESSLRDPKCMLGDMWHDLMVGRELLWQLALRDIRAQYCHFEIPVSA